MAIHHLTPAEDEEAQVCEEDRMIRVDVGANTQAVHMSCSIRCLVWIVLVPFTEGTQHLQISYALELGIKQL